MLSRHGARYPTLGQNVFELGKKIKDNARNFTATGALSFLNNWSFEVSVSHLSI